jgi:tape measure domain-containing protein
LILNLGQVRTQGKLTGRELRDFSVLGVPLIDALSKSLGVTKEKIADMTSAGEISERVVVDAFNSMSGAGGRFGNLMEKQNKTLAGQWSNLQDSLIRLARIMGEPFVEPLTRALTNINKALSQMIGFVRLAQKEWAAFFTWLDEVSGGILTDMANGIAYIGKQWSALFELFAFKTNLKERIEELGTSSTDSFGEAAEAIGGYGGAMEDAGEKAEEESKRIAEAMQDMEKVYGENVSEISRDLADMEAAHEKNMGSIQEKIDKVGQSMIDLRSKYTETMSDIGADIAEAVVDQEQKVSELRDKASKTNDNKAQTLEELRKAEEALQRMQTSGVASEAALAEARRRAALEDNERRIEDLQNRKTEETAEFEKRLQQYTDEQTALEAQKAKAIEVYEVQRDQMRLTVVRLQAMHDSYVQMLGSMDNVTADKVKSMTEHLGNLKELVDQINALLTKQGDAGLSINQAIAGAAERGMVRAERAYGGMADGWTKVGEHGPELVNLPSGSHVSEAGSTRRQLNDAESIGGITIQGPLMQNVTIKNDMDINDVVSKAMDEMARQVRLKRIKQL